MPNAPSGDMPRVMSAVMPGAVTRRVLPAFDQWQEHFHDASWLLVGHAGTNSVILARHLALPLTHLLRIPQPYACRTQFACPLC